MTRESYGAVQSARERHEFWRNIATRLAFASSILGLGVVVSVSAAWWSFSQIAEPRYFLATEDGGIIPIVAVNQPYLDEGQVTNFAVEAITKAMTIDFVNWRSDLSEASEYFERPSGWSNFLEAIEGSGTLDLIRERRLVASTVANGAVVVRSGAISGRYTWVVQVPITITYQSSSESKTENRMAEIEVARLPTWQTSRGVGITRVLIR